MQKATLLTFILASIFLMGFASAILPQEQNIIARYDFEEGSGTNFSDVYSISNDGELSGSDYSWEQGIVGDYSLHFGGTDASLGRIPSVDATTQMCEVGYGCAIAFYINLSTSSTGNANISGDIIGNNDGGSMGWSFTIDSTEVGGSSYATLFFGDGYYDTESIFAFNETLYHIVISKDSSENFSLYVDGESVNLNTIVPATSLINTSRDILLGALPTGWGLSNNMTIDELIFWNSSLTQEDVTTLLENYEQPSVTPETTPSYQSEPTYQVLRSSGAGLGIFLQLLGQSLPILLISLTMIGIIVAIGLGISQVIAKSMK